mgnify:CR=1 FL=1
MMNDIFDTVAGFLTDPVIKIPNRRFIPDCLTQVVCTGRNLSYLGCKTDYIVGGSINFNYEQSLAGALGEFVERYAGVMENMRQDYIMRRNSLLQHMMN